jgi:hypothetical protein
VQLGGPLGELACGHPLEHRADLVEFDRGRGDDRALVRDGRHQTLGRELAQHLADGRPRAAGPLDQLTFDEPLCRLEAPIDDRLAQLLEDLLAHRGSHPRHLHRQAVDAAGVGARLPRRHARV